MAMRSPAAIIDPMLVWVAVVVMRAC